MLKPLSVLMAFAIVVPQFCWAQESAASNPGELELLKATVGVWDAEIKVWATGLDSPPLEFKGVETNRAFGEHWIASDFESEFNGQSMKVHSIVGYDLDKKKMIGTVVDHGPYAASMTGTYEPKTKTLTWMTHAKDLDGSPMLQKTVVTQESDDKRVVMLMLPGEQKDTFTKFMRITLVRRK